MSRFLDGMFLFIIFASLTACTYNISMVHTEGEATDVIDDTDNVSPDISPTLSVPASVI